MSSWVKIKFSHLRRWREYAKIIAKTAREIDPNVRVYVFGGVAEDRITVLSDIDIQVLFPKKLTCQERLNLKVEIMDKAIGKYGLPFDTPVELHVVDGERAKEYFKYARKVIEID